MNAPVSCYTQVENFVHNNKVLCICTLGLAIAVYAAGVLAGRMITWIKEAIGLTARANIVAQPILNQPQQPNPQPLVPGRVGQNQVPSAPIPAILNPPAPSSRPVQRIVNSPASDSTPLQSIPNPPAPSRVNQNSVMLGSYQSRIYQGIEIQILQERNICSLDVDAIVNAANDHLAAGAGVCGAIHTQGGNTIFEECATYLRNNNKRSIEEGKAMITSGGNLRAMYVIHAVGPRWKGTTAEEATRDHEKLLNAYKNSLIIAHQHNLTSIAFPSLSTGIFGFPLEQAAPIAIQAFVQFIDLYPETTVRKITMAVWPGNFQVYTQNLRAELDKAEDNLALAELELHPEYDGLRHRLRQRGHNV